MGRTSAMARTGTIDPASRGKGFAKDLPREV